MESITLQVITTPVQVGKILAARRKALKLSQQAVAARLDIVQSRLSELEEDPSRIPLERLIAVAGVLGLELVLRDRTEPPPSDW